MNQSKRKKLKHVVGFELGPEMGARSILFQQAIATLAGVSATDLKCLDYVRRGGDVTAGDLARLTGLTTGAITAAMDRLEKAGLARRERSPVDRRKVLIRLSDSPLMKRIMPFYESLANEVAALLERYSSKQLETIRDFCEGSIGVLKRQTEVVRLSAKK